MNDQASQFDDDRDRPGASSGGAEWSDLLESCRPNRNDLALPEMAELATRLKHDASLRDRFNATQRWDAELSQAFHDVPVPAGLADRLLACVHSQTGPVSALDEACTAVPAPTPMLDAPALSERPSSGKASSPQVAAPGAKRRRVRVAGWSISAAMVAACAAVVLLRPWLPGSVPTAELEAEVAVWTQEMDQWSERDWRRDNWPSDAYPLDPAVRGRVVGWRSITTQYDEEAVVYELASRGSSRAVVYVANSDRPFDLPTGPYQAISPAGWQAGAWKTPQTLYVLAVRNARLADYLETTGLAADSTRRSLADPGVRPRSNTRGNRPIELAFRD